MKPELQLQTGDERAVEVRSSSGQLLLRYVFAPETPADESPRPYAHPVHTLSGELVTNFRPNDHRWHHGLSFTATHVSGHNFWGGGSYRKADGYQWRADHGAQRHVAWIERRPERLAHVLEWVTAAGEVLLREERVLSCTVESPRVWSLRWKAALENVAGRELVLGHYHSHAGLVGSHYTGLQFRGARDLLDEHGDATIGIFAEGGLSGETAVHGAAARWMEWRGQKDLTQARVIIRFVNESGPLHWFVRRGNPLAAFAFHYDRDEVLAPRQCLAIDHRLVFSDA